MSDLLRIRDALRDADRSREATWLASLIGIEGSAYRRPGARLLFGRDGALAGGLSAGCIDRDVVRSGAWSSEGGPIVRSYDPTDDETSAGARSGCGGKLRVLIEPVSAPLACLLQTAAEQLEQERRIALATVIAARAAGPQLGERVLYTSSQQFGELSRPRATTEVGTALTKALGAKRSHVDSFTASTYEAMLEVMDPAPHCFVFGAGEDTLPVVQLARILDWRMSICAPYKRFSVGDRFAKLARIDTSPLPACVETLNGCGRPLALVMGHDYDQDRAALAALLGSRARYIGVLGPAQRTRRMLAEIGSGKAVDPAVLSRVYGPAGLHLGGETPAEIALSMLAEAQAVLAGTDAGGLRDRKQGIHGSTA